MQMSVSRIIICWHQAIKSNWIDSDVLSIGATGTNFSEIWIQTYFLSRQCNGKISFVQWWSFRSGHFFVLPPPLENNIIITHGGEVIMISPGVSVCACICMLIERFVTCQNWKFCKYVRLTVFCVCASVCNFFDRSQFLTYHPQTWLKYVSMSCNHAYSFSRSKVK